MTRLKSTGQEKRLRLDSWTVRRRDLCVLRSPTAKMAIELFVAAAGSGTGDEKR
jgi:hypothetical protein